MLSDLNNYLINDLSLLVIEYVKFSDKQLSLIMNEKKDSELLWQPGTHRFVTEDEAQKVATYFEYNVFSLSRLFAEDNRISVVDACSYKNNKFETFMVNTENFFKGINITKAMDRYRNKSKKFIHFHGSTIVVADDDFLFRVYDFDSDFT